MKGRSRLDRDIRAREPNVGPCPDRPLGSLRHERPLHPPKRTVGLCMASIGQMTASTLGEINKSTPPVRLLRSCPSPGPTSFRFRVREAATRDHQDPATRSLLRLATPRHVNIIATILEAPAIENFWMHVLVRACGLGS